MGAALLRLNFSIMAEAGSSLSPSLQSALDAIDRAIDGMSDAQLTWHPAGKWCAAEILEHLSLAYGRTAERMKPLTQQGRPEVRRRTVKELVGGLIVLKLGRIPQGRKAPEAVAPKGMSARDARSAVRENLLRMDTTIAQCEQRFGSRKNVMVHPVLGPLSTAEWRTFHCLHTLHHVRQIATLRERMKMAASTGQSEKTTYSSQR
jgi:hypothetical protein